MKKIFWFVLLGSLMMAAVAAAATFRVVTEEATIRKDRKFFAPVVTRVPYGEVLQEKAKKGDWLMVNYKGRQGWIHVSAVQQQQFDWSSVSGGRAAEATRDEVALAGKGFTPEVEKSYRGKNPKMRYDLVTRVESYRLSEGQIENFIRAGNLREPGGEP
jgi:hypothetical protein